MKRLMLVASLIFWFYVTGLVARAEPIHESATLGATGQTGGVPIGGDNILGSRFCINATVQVTALGGHLFGNGTGFVALIALTDDRSLPKGNPFTKDETLALLVFDAPTISEDVRIPLDLTLSPGTYAVVIGGNDKNFLVMPLNGGSLPFPSQLRWRQATGWIDSVETRLRFVVEGSVIGEPPPSIRQIYWQVDGDSFLRRSNLDGSSPEFFETLGVLGADPIAITTAVGLGRMYWATPEGLLRASLDGTTVIEFLKPVVGLRDLAIDPVSRKIYWAAPNEVIRADYDGGNSEVVIGPTNVAIRAIAIDLIHRRLYWAHPNEVRRSDLDGANAETVTVAPVDALSLALDSPSGKLYWSDEQAIKRVNLDGTGFVELFMPNLVTSRIAVNPDDGRVYWIEGNSIMRVQSDGAGIEVVRTSLSNPVVFALDIDPNPPLSSRALGFDADLDRDVDLNDFAEFQTVFRGPREE